jgi:Na+/phosphate symporter
MDVLVSVVSMVSMLLVVGFLVWSMIRSIRDEQRRSGIRRVWANFALSLVLFILFIVSWATQALAQWQEFKNDQLAHDEPVLVRDFLVDFSQATLENWQSEFLQLFSFVTLAALFIHRGSAESRDSEDRIEQMVKDIKAKLDA